MKNKSLDFTKLGLSGFFLMKLFKKYHLIVLCLISLSGVAQQLKTIRFSRLTIKDGLSQSTVNCILEDQQGYMWIGTQDGLNRYDGYHVKEFKQDNNTRNSISNSFINSLYQDDDGLIWIGTQTGGLNIYNPRLKRFQQVNISEKGNSFDIKDVKKDYDGTYWIATGKNGVIHYDPEKKEHRIFQSYNGMSTNKTSSLYLDEDFVWVGTDGGGICLIDRETDDIEVYKHINGINSISDNNIRTLGKGPGKYVLVGTNNGLNFAKRHEDYIEFYEFKNKYSSGNNKFNVVSSVLTYSESEVWFGTQGDGLFRVNFVKGDTLVNNFQTNDYDPNSLSSNIINSLFKDRTGIIWIGTQDGLLYFDPVKQGFGHYRYKYGDINSLNDKNVWSIFEETPNIIWTGTRKGITRIDTRNNQYYHYPYVSDNPYEPNNHSVYDIKVDSSGRIWAAATGGLYLIKPSADWSSVEYEKVDYRDNIETNSDDRVFSMFIENDTTLWLACREGVSEIDLRTLEYHFFSNRDNYHRIPKEECRVVYADQESNLWLGFVGGGITKIERSVSGGDEKYTFIQYENSPNDSTSLSNNTVLSIWEEDNGDLWFGTYGGGLNKFNKETESFTSYDESDGLCNNSIYGVLGGEPGTLWLSTNFGLSKFDIKTKRFQNYYESDGIQSNEFNNGAYFRSKTSKLYFGGINGFNAFYPTEIKSNEVPPRSVITDILLFNKPIENEIDTLNEISFLKHLTLSHKQNNLTFKFAALHYTYSKGNKYKVILEGVDETAIELGDLQQINYSNLSPGDYTFKVWASNSDGVWVSEPTEINITITPPFWRTWWFITICVAFILLVVYVSYIVRIQTMKAQKRKLAYLVERRTKTITKQKEQMEAQKLALEVEKEKADKLLANILPVETAEELKNKGKARTRYYRMVTVMFTDIKGFTRIAETMKPSDLVKRLDNLFREFDRITEKHQIEKIKTIGDSYMAAGGVPLRDKENPINSVLAALEIQSFMKQYKEKHQENTAEEDIWQLRIGIHTGDVIAGVIGTKRIAYDVWGNTVNVANRMEMSGEPNKVNISGSTYELVKPYFDCTYRGKIPAKNKGEIDMYFVDRIKPHLSVGGEGIVPNQKFKDYVNLHIYSSINYRKAERHIMRILKSKLSPNLHYHGIHHTLDVVEAVERIAIMEGVLDEDIFVLKSAATYHDAGFVEQYDENEPVGARMATEILPKYGYTEEQVKVVHKLIYATIIPHNPKSHLEEIICDADLDYLGRDDFHEISDTLRRELRDHGKINSDRVWDEIQVKFLTMHKYFTKSSIKLRQHKKMLHLEEIKKRLEENNYKD